MKSVFLEWTKSIGLEWSESLPYSGLTGWTDGLFSIIHDGKNTESLRSAKARYEWHKRNFGL